MGSACCVAARDKSTILTGPHTHHTHPHTDVLQRNIRYSPTWSFRWENRGRVAGEDTSISWFSDGISRNDGSEIKYESALTSENGSPLESFQRGAWQKSPISEGTAPHLRTPTSDRSISRNASLDVSLEEVETKSTHLVCSPINCGTPFSTNQSPAKVSQSLASTSSVPTSLLSSQSPNTNISKKKVSDSRFLGAKSSNCSAIKEEKVPSWNNESSTRGSYGGSSDGWSMHAFSELMANSQRERWSFDSESTFGFNRERLTQFSDSPRVDHLQSCGVCLKPMADKSSWSSQRIISCDVVAVLTCGHVYHAECLENMTSEIDKYDPACPVCMLGVKQARKLSEKALKAGMELKAKHNKKSRGRVLYSDFDSESFLFDRFKKKVNEAKGLKMESSSSSKGSSGKPFLRRHFSFGSKGSNPISDDCPSKKKGFFWTKSSKN
ncbi:hypothetical protein ACFE04_016893 [Oxalis oulophora]